MSIFRKLMKNDDGATAIEYGLIAAGIAVAIVVVVRAVGSQLVMTFNSVKSGLG